MRLVRLGMPALLLVAVVLVQVSIVQRIEIGDSSADIIVLTIVSIALLTTSVHGAVYGFFGGMSLALFAALPLGPHAMLGTIVGYWAGRWGELLTTDEHPLPPMVAGLAATFAMQVGRPISEFLINPAVTTMQGIWAEAVVVTALNSVLVFPVFLLTRRVLALAVDADPSEAVVEQ